MLISRAIKVVRKVMRGSVLPRRALTDTGFMRENLLNEPLRRLYLFRHALVDASAHMDGRVLILRTSSGVSVNNRFHTRSSQVLEPWSSEVLDGQAA